jgi:replicative DNA helicase
MDELPPHDIDAEKAVLGSLMINRDWELIKSVNLTAADFFNPENQLVYEACLIVPVIDQVTVARELADHDRLEKIGGRSYLAHLISVTPTSLHAGYYGKIVQDLAIRRRLISAGQQITDLGYSEPDPKVALEQARFILSKVEMNEYNRED